MPEHQTDSVLFSNSKGPANSPAQEVNNSKQHDGRGESDLTQKAHQVDEQNNSNQTPVANSGVGDNLDNSTKSKLAPSSPQGTGKESNIVEEQSPHPFVYWAQSQTHITLRVDLTQVEDLSVLIDQIDQRHLTFSAKGRGAHGLRKYQFKLNFLHQVEKIFDCHRIERHVLILIRKLNETVKWSRLTKEQIKSPWLRFDFDRYAGEDSDDSSKYNNEFNYDSDDDDYDQNKRELAYSRILQQQTISETLQQPNYGYNLKRDTRTSETNDIKAKASHDSLRKIRNDNFDIFNPFNKFKSDYKIEQDNQSKTSNIDNTASMKYDYRKDGSNIAVDNGRNSAKQLDYKKTYLFLYNLVMFIMFLKVYIVLLIKFSNGTMDDDILQSAAFIIKMLTYTQLLETLHPMLGLVPGGPLMPFTQVIGRILVNYFLTESTIRLDSAPYAHYLFIVWSSIEIFRYPFYALRVFKVNVYLLTWCRYTLFLPLYPMGGFFESMVILSTIKFYEKTGQYSLKLPNSANISFSLPTFLRIYTFFLLGPTIYYLMRYMWTQRAKQLKQKVD